MWLHVLDLNALFWYSCGDVERRRENINENIRYSGRDSKKVLPEA
jgi:hypothetical protein